MCGVQMLLFFCDNFIAFDDYELKNTKGEACGRKALHPSNDRKAMAATRDRKTTRADGTKRQHGTTVHSALHHIRQLIVEGKLSPGTWIVESELAKRLQLSRTPARAALQWLQQEGYVRVHRTAHNKSRMIVSSLTKEDAGELYAVIGRLEGLAGRITASLPKSERTTIVEKLKALNQQLAQIRKQSQRAKQDFRD